jgi:hypothetical protein
MGSKLRYKRLPIQGDTMLSDEQLQRIGDSYRRGYQDGYARRKKREDRDTKPSPGLDPWRAGERPFVGFDYSEGYQAGANDARWDHQAAAGQRLRFLYPEILNRSSLDRDK